MSLQRKNVSTPKDEWQTPIWLFKLLDDEFHFGLDAAANLENAKCEHYLHLNSLECNWRFQSKGKPVFLNPPHSKGNIDKFMEKTYEEYKKFVVIVCLIPVDSSTGWWHKYVMNSSEIRFIKGRVDYVGLDLLGNKIKQSPTFSSCVVIFDKDMKEDAVDAKTVCGLDEPCDEGYTKSEGEPCSLGWKSCYEDWNAPRIGKTIKNPKKVKSDV